MQGKITKRTVDALKPGAKDRFLWDTELKGFWPQGHAERQ